VGRGVRVYWADDEAWYEGFVTAFDPAAGKHHVRYDDGDTEWVALGKDTVEFVEGKKMPLKKKKKAAPAAAPAAAAGAQKRAAAPGGKAAKRKRGAAVIESDDSGGEEAEAAASGSEYAASEADDDGASEDESLAEEESEEEASEEEDDDASNDEDDGSPAPRAGKKASAAGKGKGKGKGGAAAAGASQRTPGVALNSGFSITPNSEAAGAGKPAAAAAAPRPAAGHAPAPAAALRSALDRASPAAAGAAAALSEAAADDDVARFSGRDAARFPFLQPSRIRDAARRRPGEPGYDPRTLHVPADWFKAAKVSEGQRQWWDFKAAHYDAVLLFKMGKFYELFEMDAHVGAEVLGLSYMKGDQPHCGFPEAAYHAHAERLARAGRRVVVVEQTETPEGLARRNDARRAAGQKKEGVVRREAVAVLTRGTLTDAEMLGAAPDAQYLMAVAELPLPPGGDGDDADTEGGAAGAAALHAWVGAAAVDAATGQVLVGQWRDDELRSRLRAALTALQPVEVVLPLGGEALSAASRRVVAGVLRRPRVNELPPGPGAGQFWSGEAALAALEGGGYYTAARPMPPVLAAMRADPGAHAAAAAALGGCLSYLKDAMLDRRVLASGRVDTLAEAYGIGADADGGAGGGGGAAAAAGGGPACMALDGPALENLEILENGDGGVAGTLLAALDHCATPFGRRRLRQWLCRPLCRAAEIGARQDAVQDLMGPAEEAAGAARRALAGLSDLERGLARLGAAGAGAGAARDGPTVVLYEDAARRRVRAFCAALRGLERVAQAAAAFAGAGATAPLLLDLVVAGRGRMPDLEGPLAEVRAAADWEEAEASGRVVPAPGVDPDFDAARAGVDAADAALAGYLAGARRAVGRELAFASLNKESHVLEAPEVRR
jgi:DNA mismatch repair protein MSH6